MRFWEATGEQSPAETFIERIYSEYPRNPFNPDQRAIVSGEGEDQAIAFFELTPSKSVRGAVELHWIQAYPQRQGVGTAAIRELQARARAAGIKMSLYPKPNGSVSQASLKRLYKRLGFNPIHKGAATMVWDPAVSEQVGSKFSDYEIAIMEGGNSLSQVIVYHGNQGGISREFITPMWWTENYDDAKYYATVNDLDGWVYKAMLSCSNPYVIGAGEDANTALMKWQELARQGYDCIHDSSVGDWLPFYAKDIQLIDKHSVDPELDEDWRHVVTGLGAASMIAGGGSAAYDAYKTKTQPTQQPSAHVQQVQTPQPKVQAPQAKPEVNQAQAVSHAQDLLATRGAQVLQKAAKAAGLKGNELAQFMAQCAHETANFTTLKELGDKNYFKKYDIKFNPEKAKQLGNIRPGDGDLYKGRGFIQLTGRYNYKKAGEALGLPLEKKPQLVERPDVAAKVALWFWKNRVQPNVSNFQDTQQATKPINPGLKGLSDRHNKYVGMKVATAKPRAKAAPAKVAQVPARPVKGKKA